jgi:hypothetical protein
MAWSAPVTRRVTASPGGYSAAVLTKDTELRMVERTAWNRYRKALDAVSA